MSHTLHAQRYDCVMELKNRLGDDLNLFGRGINPISNKAEAMDDFRYHIAIENHIEADHWTEKISDCFLAYCLPFYYGPPNISDYFPEEAIIPIDIFDIDYTEKTIRRAIAQQAYEKRLPAIIKAREQVLTDYNIMNVFAKLVQERHSVPLNNILHNANTEISNQNLLPAPHIIDGRHIYRRNNPLYAILDGIHRIYFKNRTKFP